MTVPAFRADAAPLEGVPDAGAFRLGGRFTMDEAPEARRQILDGLRDSDASRIVLELSAVEQMDTSGAAVLAEAVKFAESHGKNIVLCHPSESVLRIFRLAGFEEVLRCCCNDVAETRRRLMD